MNVLILDDSPTRHAHLGSYYQDHSVTHAYTYRDCLHHLGKGGWDIVSLDMGLVKDLPYGLTPDKYKGHSGESHPHTGFHVAQYIGLLPTTKLPKEVVVHAAEPALLCKWALDCFNFLGVLSRWEPCDV
ncbi:MAG: hypothetical protein EBZ48_18125 [Proteobacteria bacterium]|nr:hypothetical protein [Pseudomonadota bacterium]